MSQPTCIVQISLVRGHVECGLGTTCINTNYRHSVSRQRTIEPHRQRPCFKDEPHPPAGQSGKTLTPRQDAAHKTRSKVRARASHVFGTQHTSLGGKFVRNTGIVRATVKIEMQKLAYNMRRLAVLERAAIVAT
jgi:hypothetical protein